MKTIEEINQSSVKKITSERKHPDFFPGDIITVSYTHLTLPTNREV